MLRVDAIDVHFAGIRERLLHGASGDLVEHHAPIALGGAAEHFHEVPRDRFALAVEVGRQVHVLRSGRETLEFLDDLLLARNHLVGGRPIVVRIHAHTLHQLGPRAPGTVFRPFLGWQLPGFRRFLDALLRITRPTANRQVADVPGTRLHYEVAPEVTVDGRRLGGRLDDDQRTGHDSPCCGYCVVERRTNPQRSPRDGADFGGAYIRPFSRLSTATARHARLVCATAAEFAVGLQRGAQHRFRCLLPAARAVIRRPPFRSVRGSVRGLQGRRESPARPLPDPHRRFVPARTSLPSEARLPRQRSFPATHR